MQVLSVTRYAARKVLGVAALGVTLCWSAEWMDGWPAWAPLGVMTVWTAATAVLALFTL